MWPFKKKIPAEPVVEYQREVTFAACNIVNGKNIVSEAGVLEGPANRFSPWVYLDGAHGGSYIFPRRIPMTRERAERAAHLLGTGMEIVALLSRDQLLDKADD